MRIINVHCRLAEALRSEIRFRVEREMAAHGVDSHGAKGVTRGRRFDFVVTIRVPYGSCTRIELQKDLGGFFTLDYRVEAPEVRVHVCYFAKQVAERIYEVNAGLINEESLV